MLSELERANVRRHLGFGPVGKNQGGSFISYRFFVTQGLLEFRLNFLTIEEEEILLGSHNKTRPANPNFTSPDGVLIDGYLPICDWLEGQIPLISDNLDTVQAGEWKARQDELEARDRLYRYWCTKMAQFLYVPMGKSQTGNRGALIN